MSQSKMKVPRARCTGCPFRYGKLIEGRFLNEGVPVAAMVGEGPGRTEFKLGQVFVGPSGQLLSAVLDSIGAPSVWLTNSELCYGPADKGLGSHYCRDRLVHELKSTGLRRVIALGNTAAESLLPKRGGGVGEKRSRFEDSAELNASVLVTYHPAAVLRNPDLFLDFVFDLKKGLFLSTEPLRRKFDVSLASSVADLERLILSGNGIVVLDLETTGLDPLRDELLCASFTTRVGGKLEAIVVPRELFGSLELRKLLENPSIKWVGHGSKFDRLFLKAKQVADIEFWFDTMLAHYALDERRGTHGLKSLCTQHFDAPDWEAPIRSYLRFAKAGSYSLVPDNVLFRYSALDGIYTYLLFEDLKDKLDKSPSEREVFERFLVPGSNALANIELNGVKIDLRRLDEFSDQFKGDMRQLEAEMVEMTKDPRFNPRSPSQIAHYIYDVYKLSSGMGRTTKFDALKAMQGLHPLPDLILKHRKLTKMEGTYLRRWRSSVSARDGRIHSSFKLHASVTGRLSCANPNLQAIVYELDELLVAEPGNLLVQGDYSQIELRLLAIQTLEPYLIEVYREGRDLHTERAIQLFGEDFTEKQRVFCKGIHFGIIYGRGVKSLVQDAHLPGLTFQQSEQLVKEVLYSMPKVMAWEKEVQRDARDLGVIQSITGRKRRFPLVTWSNTSDVDRQSVNFMCQNPASDATLLAVVRLEKMFRGDPNRKIVLTVHDNIIAESKDELAVETGRLIKDTMERVAVELFGNIIPFPVEIKIGPNKARLEEVEYEYPAQS